jgi:hypothetical protein
VAKKVVIKIVVNGQPTEVEAEPEALADSLIEPALRQTGNVGQPPENWELRDQAGGLVPHEAKVIAYEGQTLFLNLKAGVGGQAGPNRREAGPGSRKGVGRSRPGSSGQSRGQPGRGHGSMSAEGTHRAQFVDLTVSRTKFDREIAEYRTHEAEYRLRGWFLLDVTFPIVRLLMVAPQLRPPAVVTGLELDYGNYDAVPPSVRFTSPFSGEPYRMKDLPFPPLNRALAAPPLPTPIPGLRMPTPIQPLLLAHSPDDVPFLCIAGVREYHDHPAHSGDSWQLHRAAGAGRLVRLLTVIDTYAVQPINYQVQLALQVSGFVVPQPPP